MMQYAIKVLVSALLIVAVSEVSKRSGAFWGGVLASLPLTSLLAFIWLYRDTHNPDAVIGLSWAILWLVLPSLTLFVALPILLKRGVSFPVSLAGALIIMVAAYLATAAILKRFGMQI